MAVPAGLWSLRTSWYNVRDAAPLILEYPALRHQVETYAALLAAQPKLGQYSLNYHCLRDRDVKRLLAVVA